MPFWKSILAALIVSAGLIGPALAGASPYPWLVAPPPAGQTLAERIAPPPGFERIDAQPHGFPAWLRGLPMKPAGSPVKLFNGIPRFWSTSDYAVIDIDTGKKDLQQCADALMRLRAEWLYAEGRRAEIGFNYTNGGRVDFARWSAGMRPKAGKTKVTWSKRGQPDPSYASLRSYLEQVFSYAGTYSLGEEMQPVALADMAIGDVFVQGGFPGHAVMVADMAANPQTGERRFLLVQSYMPAQDMHILKNPGSGDGSPWYPASFGIEFQTPDWSKPFSAADLKRWP